VNLCSKYEAREVRILKEDFLRSGKADPWREKGKMPKLRSCGKVDSERSSALGVPTPRRHANRKRSASAPKFKAPQKRRLRLAMMSDILPAYKKTQPKLLMPKLSMAVAGCLMKQCKMIQQRCTLYQSCVVINECCVLPGSRINTTLSMGVLQPQPPHR